MPGPENVSHKEAEAGEWFHDDRVLNYLLEIEEPKNVDIKGDYCTTLERLELAAFAKKSFRFSIEG